MKVRFIEKRPEIENVYTFIFDPEKEISWQPGQYLHYELPHPDTDDRGIERWFTISAPPYEKQPTITTRFDPERSSTFKRALLKLEPGTVVEAGEPRGDFLLDEQAEHHVLIAGGIGVTPYHSQIMQLEHDNKPFSIDLLYANRDQNFVFGENFAELAAKHSNFKIKKYVGDERITENDLKPYLPNKKILFYISGPKPMVEAYQHLLEKLDVEPERIRTDYFPGYQLG